MIKLLLFSSAIVTVVAATVITFLSINSQDSDVSNLLSSKVEALTGWEDIVDWWNSKVYDCVSETCSMTIGVAPFVATYYGTYENCEDGDSYAHCWECADCDAGPF